MLAVMVLAGAAWLPVGCERAAPPAMPLAGDGEAGSLAWRGRLPCADCAGIETSLMLQREDGRMRFELVETYLTGAGGERFVDTGMWHAGDGLLRLQGEQGSLRTYALLGDGRLQSRDAQGRHLPGGRDDALVPVSATGP